MPLNVRVGFNARLRVGNRVQIPTLIRWQHKLEPEQVLKVRVKIADAIGQAQEFYGRMRPDGRINIP